MKVALIPPTSRLLDCEKTDMVLALPHVLYEDDEYNQFYTQWGGYFILDNGAAEARRVDDPTLSFHIDDWTPDEVALPDVLGESSDTVERSTMFLDTYGSQFPDVKFGVVAQGKTIDEAMKTIDLVKDSSRGDLVKVIYLPRLLVAYAGYDARINLAKKVYKDYPECEIHFFGANWRFPTEVYHAAVEVGDYVRSIDTSLPYVYAAHNLRLRFGETHKVDRPEGYFDLEFNVIQKNLADDNVAKYLEWANGRA